MSDEMMVRRLRSRWSGAWWAAHNLVAHPVSEVCYWFRLDGFGNWLHDSTIPDHEEGAGRG